MIEAAEKDGPPAPRARRILEPSSGNTGIALAAIAQHQGLPDQDPDARERVDRAPPDARGVRRRDHPRRPAAEGSNGAVRRAQALAEEHPEWCFLYQYGNDANPRAHYEGTGPGDLARLPGDHPLRRRPRHERHAHGRRPVPQGAEPRHQGHRRRAAARRARSRGCATSTRATSRRSSRSGTAPTCSTASAIVRPARVDRVDPAPGRRVRRVRRHLVRRGAGRRGQGGRARSTRA